MTLYEALIQADVMPSLAQRMVQRLQTVPQEYTDALWAYLRQGECRLLRAQGYSTGKMMREWGLAYPQAVSVILWLLTEPEEAAACLAEGFTGIQ